MKRTAAEAARVGISSWSFGAGTSRTSREGETNVGDPGHGKEGRVHLNIQVVSPWRVFSILDVREPVVAGMNFLTRN
jgi:hypothetical protein